MLYGFSSSLFVPQSQKTNTAATETVATIWKPASKANRFEGRLNASAAVYRARKTTSPPQQDATRAATPTTAPPTKPKPTAGEIEVGGRITPEWLIQAGYSQQTRDQDGSRLNPDSVPECSFKLFTTYHFAPRSPQRLDHRCGCALAERNPHRPCHARIPNPAAKARAADNSRQKASRCRRHHGALPLQSARRTVAERGQPVQQNYRTQPDRHSYGALRTVNAAFTYRFK